MKATRLLAAAALWAAVVTPAAADELDDLQRAILAANKDANIGALVSIERGRRIIEMRTGFSTAAEVGNIASGICEGSRESGDERYKGVTIKIFLKNGVEGASCTV